MSQLQSEKFNIAWFKLAEFVSRKEKERALGIYKLLIHSLPNDAIAAQLEGDLLLAFHDEKALQSYTRAVELYERLEDPYKAVAVCEHCLTLLPDSIFHIEHAARLYLMIGDHKKALHYADYLGKILAVKGNHERCLLVMGDENFDEACRVCMAHSFILETLKNKPLHLANLEKQLMFVIDRYAAEASKKLNGFLASLELVHEPAFVWATDYIKKQNLA
jgi:tetratricopeptide (TPR) repeat protein